MTRRAVLALALLLAGCPDAPAPRAEAWREVPEAALDEAQRGQRERALAARDALAGRLMSRLSQTIAEGGPAAAIPVCQAEAPAIARQVAAEQGLAVGRTSFRLRNQQNQPPAWAAPLVERRVAEPTFVAGPAGALGALLPLRAQALCVTCHGPAERIPDDVRQALAAAYPDDAATGFAEGDLRGWVWVEVPGP
ncbi:MAG: DUF3365 domain-containing protein [Planctomycetes bacterium]|nr:DUF3365 domain-containing protein [Planctomycetota bacterium]